MNNRFVLHIKEFKFGLISNIFHFDFYALRRVAYSNRLVHPSVRLSVRPSLPFLSGE